MVGRATGHAALPARGVNFSDMWSDTPLRGIDIVRLNDIRLEQSDEPLVAVLDKFVVVERHKDSLRTFGFACFEADLELATTWISGFGANPLYYPSAWKKVPYLSFRALLLYAPSLM
jgi:hypothetical protein